MNMTNEYPAMLRKIVSNMLLTVLFCFAFSKCINAQVQPMPWEKAQFFDNNGKPVSGGCLFTYISNTTTPLATYTDYTGSVINSNPVILDSAGRADIWLLAQSYTLKLLTTGGVNCASGVQLWSENGINPSANSILAFNNTWTGLNTFTAPTFFNSSVSFSAGFSTSGPANLGSGGALVGSFSGSPIFSGTPNFTSGLQSTDGTFSGQIIDTALTGTPPFVISSTTNVPNLNASSINGCTFPVPCALGSTTPAAVDGTVITAHTALTINGSTPQTAVIGTDASLISGTTFTGGTGKTACQDANGGLTTATAVCAGGFTKIQAVKKTTGCTPGSGSSYDACSDTLTWPSAFADTNYIVTVSCLQPGANGGNPATNLAPVVLISSYTTTQVVVITQQERGATASCNEIHAIGVHP